MRLCILAHVPNHPCHAQVHADLRERLWDGRTATSSPMPQRPWTVHAMRHAVSIATQHPMPPEVYAPGEQEKWDNLCVQSPVLYRTDRELGRNLAGPRVLMVRPARHHGITHAEVGYVT